MVPGSDMAGLSTTADAAPAIKWRGRMPLHAALIPRKAMGSFMIEWEDGHEPEGWVARRMADAFARMEAAVQRAALATDAIREAARDSRRWVAALIAASAALAAAPVNRWRPHKATSPASPLALVATRPAHGPPALPA